MLEYAYVKNPIKNPSPAHSGEECLMMKPCWVSR
jgi:hypothetical protein